MPNNKTPQQLYDELKNMTRLEQYEYFIRSNDEKLCTSLCTLLQDEQLGLRVYASRFTINTLMNIWENEHHTIMDAFADVNGRAVIQRAEVPKKRTYTITEAKKEAIKKLHEARDRAREAKKAASVNKS